MKKSAIVLSLVASAILHTSTSFARNYFSLKGKQFNRVDEESRGLEFYPVKLNKGKEREGIPFENMRIKLLTDKPLVSIDRFELTPVTEKNLGVKILVDSKEADAVGKMGKKYGGSLIGIFYQGKPLAVIKGTSKQSDEAIVFSYPDEAKFERLVSNLASQMNV